MDKNLFNLSEQPTVANQYLRELRDATLQKDRMRFRRNLERLGEIMAYEISKKLTYESKTVKTPLGDTSINVVKDTPVLVTVLRAGLPFHEGFLHVFDHADSGFIGAWRNEDVNNLKINVDYVSLPTVAGKPLILIDPMLATGQSVLNAVKQLVTKGTPSHIFIVSVVSAPEGLHLLRENLTLPYSVWTCALDEKLNSSFYIVPGLGDAGDLCFGLKD
jgi:uracil phosphoribosyltransferase